MRKIVLYIATSIDGFIARKNGDIDWLENPDYPIEGEDFGYQKFYDSIDTTLMGNQTYQQVLGFDVPFPYKGKTNYVFSRSQEGKDENVQFVKDNIADFVKNLKKDEGKDIWLVGGGQLNSMLLGQELIDQIILTIIPITLGDGISLFAQSMELDTRFSLDNSKVFKNGFVQLFYTNLV